MYTNPIFYVPLLTSFVIGLALVPLCIKLAFKTGIIDNPAHRKIHSKPTAYLGGLAVFGAMVAAVGISWAWWPFSQPTAVYKIGLIGACTLAAVGMGLLDDKVHLRPRYKILSQLAIATVFSVVGYRFELLSFPNFVLELRLMSIPLTIFWMMAIVNAFNLIDGLDGLTGTVSLTIMASLATAGILVDDRPSVLMGLAGFGAVTAFLVFNWHPAKIFLGDAGSIGLGTFFAAAYLALGNTAWFGLPVLDGSIERAGIPFKIVSVTMIMIYPTLEILLSVTRRLLRGKPISSADKGHIHHRMIAMGWKAPWICFGAMALSLLAQSVVMVNMIHDVGLATLLLAALGIVLGLGLRYLGLLDLMNPLVTRYFRPHYQIANHYVNMNRLKLSLAASTDQVLQLIDLTAAELGVLKYTLVYPELSTQSSVQRDWLNPDNAADFRPDENGIQLVPPQTGFTDRCRHAGCGATIEWTFKAIEREQELDVEYRVLLAAFMQEALDRLVSVPAPSLEKDKRRKSSPNLLVSAATLRESNTGAPVVRIANLPGQTAPQESGAAK